jgi:tetratricopeptide (TPR) repeat protein
MPPDVELDSAVPDREQRLDEVIAGYLGAVRGGQAPDRQQLLADHADLAGDLAEFFADQDRFDRVAAPLRAAVGPSPSRLPETIGKHDVLGEIARGGMGVVLRARHRDLGRLVALKLLLAGPYAAAEDVQRFRHEAEAAALLDHSHIVPVYEVGEHDGLPYFSMKLMQGSLAQRLRSSPLVTTTARTVPLGSEGNGCDVSPDSGAPAADTTPLAPVGQDSSPRESARLVLQIARAVHYAHQRGILHRDLKPANILLDEHGQPHVSDFGLARRRGAPGLTRSGDVVGTPAYMAPEQAVARGEITVATDVYGLGAILYECLAGRPPFKADSPVETLRQVLDREPPRLRALNSLVDADLETICLKCLQKEPARRYASARDLAADLERYLRGETILARPVGLLTRGMRWLRREPVVAGLAVALAGAAVLLVVAVVAGFALVLQQWQRAEEGFSVAQAQRDEARDALAAAEKARRQADLSARASDESFRQAHAAVNDFCLSFSDELARAPAMQPLRRKLLLLGRRYYQAFVQQRSGDPKLRRELADTHVRVAEISSDIGEQAEALAEYRAALAIYRQLHAERPADAVLQRKLAGTLLNIATKQDTREGLATTDEALGLYERFLKEHPDDLNLQSGRALLLGNRGSRLIGAGRFAEARIDLEETLSRQDALVRRYPGSDAFRWALAGTLDNYGVLLERLGEGPASLCCYLRAHEHRQRLAAARPRDTVRAANLAAAHHHLGIAFRNLGHTAAARDAFTEALEMRRKIAAANPHVTRYQADLAASYSNQGAWANAERRREQALQSHDRARRILAGLVSRDRTSPELRKQLGESLFNLGVTYGAMKRRPEEGKMFQQARRLQEELVREDPENAEYRVHLGRTLNNLGINLWVRKQEDEAKNVLRHAIASSRLLVERAPAMREYRRLLNNHYGLIAEIEWRQGNAAASVEMVLLRQKLWPNDGVEQYRAACELGRAAALLGRNPVELPPEKRKEQDRYLDLAVAALRQAVGAGFRDDRKIREEPELELVRARPDFASLLP